MNGWIDGWMDGISGWHDWVGCWEGGWIDGWMEGWVNNRQIHRCILLINRGSVVLPNKPKDNWVPGVLCHWLVIQLDWDMEEFLFLPQSNSKSQSIIIWGPVSKPQFPRHNTDRTRWHTHTYNRRGDLRLGSAHLLEGQHACLPVPPQGDLYPWDCPWHKHYLKDEQKKAVSSSDEKVRRNMRPMENCLPRQTSK